MTNSTLFAMRSNELEKKETVMMRTFSEAVCSDRRFGRAVGFGEGNSSSGAGLAAVRIARSARSVCPSSFADSQPLPRCSLCRWPWHSCRLCALRSQTTPVDPPVASPVIEQLKGTPTTRAGRIVALPQPRISSGIGNPDRCSARPYGPQGQLARHYSSHRSPMPFGDCDVCGAAGYHG